MKRDLLTDGNTGEAEGVSDFSITLEEPFWLEVAVDLGFVMTKIVFLLGSKFELLLLEPKAAERLNFGNFLAPEIVEGEGVLAPTEDSAGPVILEDLEPNLKVFCRWFTDFVLDAEGLA